MKKQLFIFITIIILIISVGCNATNMENINEGNGDISDKFVSVDEKTEDDKSKINYEWYDQEQLDKWIEKCIAYFKEEPCSDGKHFYHYFSMPVSFIEGYITKEENNKYKAMFSCTEDKTIGHRCDYFGITKEEYKEFVEKDLDQLMMLGKYNIIDTAGENHKNDLLNWGPPYAREYMFYNYDAWFSDEFWNHPDLMYNGYVAPEIDDHYTSLKDRNGHTKRYYIIDSLLIEYVGTDEFDKWLTEKEDADQNIIEFVKDFGITREIYEDIYRETCYLELYDKWSYLPYNPDYLFGTEEMQDEYFKVHPLNKE